MSKNRAWVFVFFVALSGLSLNQLLLHIHEYVGIGDGHVTDYYHNHWNYWWIRHAITNQLPIYYTDYVLFPYENNLGFHTLAAFWFPLWALLEPLSNHLLAMNMIFWVGLSLTGFCTYLFLQDQGVKHQWALMGGVMMGVFPAFTWAAAMTLPVYVGGFWYTIPFLLWKRIAQTQQIKWSLALGIVFWMMLMTDMSSLLFIALVLAPYALYTWPGAKVLGLAILPFVVLLLLGWFIAPLQPMLAFDRDSVSAASLESTRLFSMPAEGFIRYSGQGDKGIGAVFSLLSLSAIFLPSADRQRWLWFALGIPPLILCLGPDLMIHGTRIPLPYSLIHEFTGGIFRAPVRFAPIGVLMWLVFVGRSFSASPFFAKKWGFASLVIFLILADLRSLQPFEAGKPLEPYAYYEVIAQDPDPYVIIEVPVSMGSGWIIYGDFEAAQYYGISHHKKMLNGLIARIPDSQYEFYIHDATIGWLGGFQPYQPEIQREKLAEYISIWNVGYIVVHQDHLQAGQREEIIGFLNGLDYLCPVTVERDAVFYRTASHPDFAACPPRRLSDQINFGAIGDELFIGNGFYGQEVVGGATLRWMGAFPKADLYIELPPATYQASFQAWAFQEIRPLEIYLNGEMLAEFDISPDGFSAYSFEFVADGGKLAFEWVYDAPQSAADLGLSGDTRPLSIALESITFRAK